MTSGVDRLMSVRDGVAEVCKSARMIGRLKTMVVDAADMDAVAQFWCAVLDIPVVHRDDDWTTLEGRGVRLAVQLAPDHVPPQWPHPRTRSSSTSTSRSRTPTRPSGR